MPNFFINVKERGAKEASSNIKGLTSSMKRLAIQAVGVTAVVQGVRKSINMAADMEGVKRGFDNLTKSQGFSTSAFHKFKSATDGTIDSLTLMKKANTAMLLGITDSEEQMADMFDVAQRLGKSLGIDTVQSIDSLVTGLGRQSKLMLDNLGIMIDTGKVNENYAESVGKTVGQLTDQEKKQAFVNAAMEEANSLVEQLGEEQLDMGDAIAQMQTNFGDLAITIGTVLEPIIVGASKAIASMKDFIDSIGETSIEKTIRELREFGGAAEDIRELEKIQISLDIRELNKQLDGMGTKFSSSKDVLSEIKKLEGENLELINSQVASQKNRVTGHTDLIALKKAMKAEDNKLIMMHLQRDVFNKKDIDAQTELSNQATKKFTDEKRIIEAQKESANIALGASREKIDLNSLELSELESVLAIMLKIEAAKIRVKDVEEEDDGPEAMLEQITIEDFMHQERLDKIEKQKNAFIEAGVSELDAAQFVTNQKKMMMADELKAKLNQVGALAGALGTLAGQHKQGALVAKRLAQSQAVIDTHGAANQALNSGPPPWNFIAMATVIASGLANVAQIEKAQFGMDEIVTQPTMILAGEAGAEQVSITPLEGPNVDGPQGGAVNVSFSGNVMSQDFIEDEAIPMIKSAIRRGASLGIS